LPFATYPPAGGPAGVRFGNGSAFAGASIGSVEPSRLYVTV